MNHSKTALGNNTGSMRPAALRKPVHRHRENLPLELWAMILDELAIISPRSAHTARLVNRAFFQQATESLHREVELDQTKDEVDRLHTRLEKLDSNGLLTAIRILRLRTVYTGGLRLSDAISPAIAFENLVLDYLSRMTALRTLVFQGDAIPPRLLSTLRRTPLVALEAVLQPCVGNNGDRSALKVDHSQLGTLQDMKSLRALSVDLWHFDSEACETAMQKLKGVLLTCPNIQYLALGNAFSPNRLPPYGGLNLVNGEELPALRTLDVVQYPFNYADREPDRSGRGRFPVTYVRRERDLNYWAQMECWSTLRCLKTSSTDLMIKLMPKLTALEELDLILETYYVWRADAEMETASEFFSYVPAQLKVIRVPSLEHVSINGLQRHVRTLQVLQIHQSDINRQNWDQKAISVNDLRFIRDECLGLAELSIDLARKSVWPYEALEVLATFPHLRRLELWFKLERGGTPDKPIFVQPRLTSSAAEDVLRYLLNSRQEALSDVFFLDLHCGGNTPPRRSRRSLFSESTLEPHKSSFRFEVSEGKDTGHQHEFVEAGNGLKADRSQAAASAESPKPRSWASRALAKARRITSKMAA